MKMNLKTVTSILLLFVLFSCEVNNPITPPLDEIKNDIQNRVNVESFDINILSYENLPNTMWGIRKPGKEENIRDKDSIELFMGQYYHPGLFASRIEKYLDGYFQTKDSLFLFWAKKYFTKLIFISEKADNNSILFPFEFDWLLENKTFVTMKAPWYSAMTQGTALMDATRLYEFTNDAIYLEYAKQIFNGYYNMKGYSKPWITQIDDDNYFWLEEYPLDDLSVHVFNGYMYSIMGLYEYYKSVKDPDALFLLNASLTTMKHYVWEFRNRGGISYYSLRFKQQKAEYHGTHIFLLRCLFYYSNDPFFNEMADLFYKDYHNI